MVPDIEVKKAEIEALDNSVNKLGHAYYRAARKGARLLDLGTWVHLLRVANDTTLSSSLPLSSELSNRKDSVTQTQE